jgi:hypothetical protein
MSRAPLQAQSRKGKGDLSNSQKCLYWDQSWIQSDLSTQEQLMSLESPFLATYSLTFHH